MATFVLVHPAWFGGWCWEKLAPLLLDAGCEVCTPTLTGLGDRIHLATPEVGLATHIEDVVQTMTYADLADVILVGNSSGGTACTSTRSSRTPVSRSSTCSRPNVGRRSTRWSPPRAMAGCFHALHRHRGIKS